jgi:hypothetical protein
VQKGVKDMSARRLVDAWVGEGKERVVVQIGHERVLVMGHVRPWRRYRRRRRGDGNVQCGLVESILWIAQSFYGFTLFHSPVGSASQTLWRRGGQVVNTLITLHISYIGQCEVAERSKEHRE